MKINFELYLDFNDLNFRSQTGLMEVVKDRLPLDLLEDIKVRSEEEYLQLPDKSKSKLSLKDIVDLNTDDVVGDICEKFRIQAPVELEVSNG